MSLEERVLEVESRIAGALSRSGRVKGSVSLVGVSKRQPLEIIQEYCDLQKSRGKEAILGENYVQEFLKRKELLSGPYLSHLIGPLQRNKIKSAVRLFDVIETVYSERMLSEINKEAADAAKIQPVFLQVNVSKDKAKSGFMPEAINSKLLDSLASYSSLRIEGLMTITRLYDKAEQSRPDYRMLRELGAFLKAGLSLPRCCLSMGMSDDFEVAIEEGATHIRIGNALFGERICKNPWDLQPKYD